MHDLGLNVAQIRDGRYDAVLHMVTAADGAKEHYNTWIRGDGFYQSSDDAVEKDEMLRKAYSGHRRWQLVRNMPGKSLQDKIDFTRKCILHTIALECETATEQRKFELRANKLESNGLPIALSEADVNKVSLITMETESVTVPVEEGVQTLHRRTISD